MSSGSFRVQRFSATPNKLNETREIFEDMIHSDAYFNSFLPLGQLGRDYLGGGWNFIRYSINNKIHLMFSPIQLRFSTMSIILSKIQLLIVNIYLIFYELLDVFFKQSAILAFFVLFWFSSKEKIKQNFLDNWTIRIRIFWRLRCREQVIPYEIPPSS